MKYAYPQKPWFTLIEVIVALTIFSLTMISVMTIFYLASQMSTRVELNRSMQENIKNTLDIIAEDIRTGSIDWVRGLEAGCLKTHQGASHILCLASWLRNMEIAVWKKVSDVDWGLVGNIGECQNIDAQCFVIKREQQYNELSWAIEWGSWYPLTNSKSHITQMRFTFLNEDHPRVQISLGIRPAAMQWMTSNLIESQEIIVQTTLSERFIRQK